MICDVGRTAAGLEPRLIVVCKYRGWLAPVSHAQIELAQFTLKPARCFYLVVGIIEAVLVDYRAHKVEVGRRLDAKSLTLMDAA